MGRSKSKTNVGAQAIEDVRSRGNFQLPAEEWYRALFENSLNGIFVTIPETGIILAANLEVCRILGYTRDQLCSLHASELVDMSDPRLATAGETRRATGACRGELTFRRANGELFPVEFASTVYIGSDGQSVSVNAITDISERKSAEAALRASEAALRQSEHRYRQLAEQSTDFIWITDDQGRFTYASPSYERISGYAPETLIGNRIGTHAALESRNFVNDMVRQYLDTATKGRPEMPNAAPWQATISQHMRRDGGIWWAETHTTPIFDAQGKFAGLAGVARDITARKQMEFALRESERRLQAASEVAALGVWSWDRHADVVTWDDRMCAIHGVPPGSVSTRSAWIQVVHPDDRAATLLALENAMGTDRQVSVEYRVTHPDGAVHFVLCAGGVSADGEDANANQLGVCLDVTERRHTEESISRLAAIVEASSDAVVSTRFDGTIISWNKSAEQMYGYPAADVLGQNLFEILSPGQKVGMPVFVARIRQGESIRLPDLVWVTPDKRKVDMAVTLAPIPDQAGNWVGISSIAHDITDRKRAEAAVAESESRLKAVIENTTDRIWSIDQQYRVLVANSASVAAALAEYGQPLVVGQSAVDFPSAPEIQPFWQPIYDRVLAGETVRLEDVTPETATALELVLHPIRDASGNVTGVVARATDITERRRLAEALHNSEMRLKAIIENSSDMIWSVDRDYRILVANTACIESTKSAYGHALAPGDSVIDAPDAPIVREMWKPHYDRAFDGAQDRFEFDSPLRPGRTMECFLDPIRDEQGDVTGVAGRITDITERLAAEVQVLETVQRLRLAADAAGIGVWNWNFADNSLEWDDRMCELYGVPKSTLDNAIYYDVWRSRVHPDDQRYAETTLNEAVRSGNPWRIFFRIVLPNRAVRYIQTSSVITYDRKGMPMRMIGINRDVTEQMTYEKLLQDTNAALEQRVAERTIELRNLIGELERANAGKDAFLAAVSHELRTPLSGILAMAESLQEEVCGPLNEQQKRYVAAITESGDRLLRMVTSVLRYVAAMAADAPVPLERCRMAELCAVAVRNAKARAGAKQQTIEMDVEPFELEVRSNGDAVMQIIDILLDNAIKFTAKQGKVGVRAVKCQDDGAFQLVVWDTGIGISEAQKAYLFQPFTQVDQRLARAYEGIGLGLALAKRIVDLLGGSIEVTSEVGKGSEFIVTLSQNKPS